MPSNELDAVGDHLYNVSSSGGYPADQVTAMTAFAAACPSSLKFETEYYQSPGFSNADRHP